MDKFIVNIIHRPEMVPEYAEKVTGQGKAEDLGRKALLTESLDIFKTQQENLLSCGAEIPQNITFYTYAKLVLLDEKELSDIFGRDLINDQNMTGYFSELTGESEHKPFECVGSIDEVNLAVTLAVKRMNQNGEPLPKLFGKYEKSSLYHPETAEERNSVLCSSFSNDNLLPEKFRNILIREMERLL